ncbi:TlyA family RNA methyltransferase [Corynebacterium sp. 320]|uniref:TlyA family RNA methyltransferase n=1 Tax=Corynebacterium TaxID=1716 RepID=UPI00125CB38C|nr:MULTISPECIES: TlyA family RNA methyltransferase [Corynebacterium]KAB1503573.1 TlyA family RNA methyltransferase [Corynebacterium sp. 320]KAB1553326.1 TlyA family RNA methyltransferase [Corynebacterium sp. 321]KAB1553456.1 TlyA family RNA methyltransferase [Corynebacterium sp. 319]KAB3527709.1 TlyA family RNA methyltransferase [Corynebacterium sp. 250]KAB3540800.1 TlyA family RNA methyltransferase [Corynebacterium sp. 366]
MAKKGQKLQRLDAELVKRKIARSREHAQDMIKGGRVSVNGMVATKPATGVTGEVSIKVTESDDDRWASRGAHKLIGALEAFEPLGLSVSNKTVLDAGASTGGFTDVCLDRGASRIAAVDVGYGQLIWRLQNNPRVDVFDRTNVRTLTPEILGGQMDMMVGDLSFISIELVLPALAECIAEGGDLLPMVKPQFEVGKDRLGSGGVVRSPELRAEVTLSVARAAMKYGLSTKAVVASPLPGPSGNVEYFLWLVKDGGHEAPTEEQLCTMVETAVKEGPQ